MKITVQTILGKERTYIVNDINKNKRIELDNGVVKTMSLLDVGDVWDGETVKEVK